MEGPRVGNQGEAERLNMETSGFNQFIKVDLFPGNGSVQ